MEVATFGTLPHGDGVAGRAFEQVRLPGTFREYPKWRRKIGNGLEEIAVGPRVAAIARDFDERVRRGEQT